MELSTQQNLLNQVEENSSNNGTYKDGDGHDQDYTQASSSKKGFTWERLFGSRHPYEDITWETRTAKIVKGDGTVVFEQNNIEVPNFWSQTATDIVASKYFRGRLDSPEREYSAKQMVDRIAKTIGYWGFKDGYFSTLGDATNFVHDLTYLLINQYAAFNSPVWFNVGVHARPQVSACQPYRALISTPRGFFRIGDIVENNLVGFPVYDSRGTTRVIAVKNNGKKKVFKIILKNGTFIEATGDHLIRAVEERRTIPVWVRLDQLKKGMCLHIYPHKNILSSEMVDSRVSYYKFDMIAADGHVFNQVMSAPYVKPENLIDKLVSEAALAGWIQADGFAEQYKTGTNRSLTLEFLTVNDEEKNWITQHLEIVFPDVHKKIRVVKTKLGTPITRIRLYGEKIRWFIEKYDLLKRRDKIRAPEIIWRSKPEIIASYLKSVFQGEGYVSIRKAENYESGRLAIATISKNWIHDIQILLYGLGIYSRIKVKQEKRFNRQNLYELAIAVGSEKIKFKNLVGFIGNDKIVKLESALRLQDQKNIHDLREEEIVSIEELGIETVYDIQTESGEYLTNNVVVHNCFILSVEDNMQSILDWYRDEGWIFKYGSGSGTNLSKLRSSKEPLSHGGFSSGPVSFMKGADGVANSIRSGGTTRRAAKMVVLNVDHPDIKNFIYCKKIIEDMTKALASVGIKDSIEADLFDPYTLLPYQNANNSVRVSDEFMRALEGDGYWNLTARTTGKVIETIKARELMNWITDAAWHSADPGMQYDTTINEWHTLSNTSRINASNPCSEYMSIDNSSCNLASLNLLKFLQSDSRFNVDFFRKAVDTMITSMDIIIDNASFPTEKIEKNTRDYRQLGLGYANLGALLMVMGLSYDSESGRSLTGQITSLMCGEAYRMSALIADVKRPFNGYELNKEPMLGVIRKHLGEAEKLRPFMDGFDFDNADLYENARAVWHEALQLGRKYGIRNSQATVLAPTGTIAFLMDCDTTGIEPELALIKYKKLVGGGTLKLINHKVPQALKKLGYNEEQIEAISKYLLDRETIEGAPHLRDEHLSVFDCSFKASNGARSIHYMGHVRMMAAAQPFISGAISKTVNLPTEATIEDIKNVFIEGWRLGLKAIAVYRDGSKSIQPLNTKKEEEEKKKDELVEKSNGYTRIKLPDERPSITHKFSVGGYESYLTVGLYPDTNKPGETFITTAKEGSTVAGLFDTIATLVSMCLQSGMPLKSLVRKFKDMRFEPSGFTNNPQIPMAKSVMDYVFRYIGMKYLSPEDREEIFGPDPFHQNGSETNHSITELINKDVSKKEAILAIATPDNDQHKITYQVDPLHQVHSEASAPACANCGTLMFKAGSCYSCPNCFATTGVCN